MPLTLPNPRAHESHAHESLDCSALAPRPQERAPAALQQAPARFDAPATLRFWHLASLDAPTVAAVWSLAFAWAVHARLPVWVLLLQVLVVWTVYVWDRLLDARAGLRRWDSELRERHFYHWRHRRVLVPLAVAAGCAAACMVLRYMPAGVRERDSVLAVACLVYFTRVHAVNAADRVRRIVSKELLVGVLFTVGCALPACSHGAWLELGVPVLFFAAVAWLNCRAIERWESGRAGIARAAMWTAIAGFAIASVMAGAEPRVAALIAAGAASALLLAGLERMSARMTPIALRAAADLVLFTPALLLFATRTVWL